MRNPSTNRSLAVSSWRFVLDPLTALAKLHWPLVLTGTLLLTLIWATVLWESQRIHDDHLAKYRGDLSHLSELLDEMVARQLHSIDSALLILREEYTDHRQDLERLIKLLRRDPLRGDDVYVTVIDRDGHLTYTDLRAPQQPLYLGDRPHFRYFAEGGHDRLYIGEPLIGRLAKSWSIPLARPVFGKDGQFRGIVTILMPPEQLTRFVHSLDIANDTMVTLVADNGAILSHSRDMGSHLGKTLPPQQMAELRRHARAVALPASGADPAQHGVAHRWIHDYPLLLMVSRTSDAAHAEITGLQRQLVTLGTIASLIVMSSLLLLGVALHQRRKAQQTLQREHQHLVEAQRIAMLGSWELAPPSQRMSWSDEIARILEIDVHTAPGTLQAYLGMVHPQDRHAVRQAYGDSLRQTGPFHHTHRLITRNGRIKWVRAQWMHEFDAAGQPARTSGTLQDITARKREEIEREALVQERILLLESTSEGIYGVDTDGKCTFINQAAARMLGYEGAEIIGSNVHSLIHHHHADGSVYPQSDCPTTVSSQTGQPCRIDNEVFWRQDGTCFPVDYASNPIRNDQRIIGSVVTFSDITQRKQVETELRIAEKAFQTQEGMFVTDPHGVILRINNAFTEITGYTAQDIVGENPRIRSSGRHDAAFYAAMWEQIQTAGFWKGEIWNRRKNGEIYPESITITAVRGDDGIITHYVGNMHDITQRKAAEEEIRNLAFYDPLTQLPNRRLLTERLQHALLASARNKLCGALMFIDLDKFKTLNDTHGHDIGDLLLQQVAQRLLACVREADTVARLGGDEFVIVLEELSAQSQEAHRLAERVGRKIIDALDQPYDLAGHRHLSTPSIGANLFCGKALTDNELLKQADLAMYHAKAAGRNTLRFFTPDMLTEAPHTPQTQAPPL